MSWTIKKARQFAGLTQEQMAEKLNIHVSTYIKIEAKPERATILQGQNIAQITGVPFDEIFFSANTLV